MKELKAYVEQKNAWRAIFKDRKLDLAYSADRQQIANSIDADLSPENLTCDGELSPSQVQKRYTQLTRAAAQLKELDPSVTMYEFG